MDTLRIWPSVINRRVSAASVIRLSNRDPFTAVKDLERGLGQTDQGPDRHELMGNGIAVSLDFDVVSDMNIGNTPTRPAPGRHGQRCQIPRVQFSKEPNPEAVDFLKSQEFLNHAQKSQFILALAKKVLDDRRQADAQAEAESAKAASSES